MCKLFTAWATAGCLRLDLSIRAKLLLLSLATLALPWAGCQYAREMESSLRDAEQQALLAVAATLATSLQGRTDLLYRNHTAPGGGDKGLTAIPLVIEPTLDGRADDWPGAPQSWRGYAGPNGDEFRVMAGGFDRYLYLLVEVKDRNWIFDASNDAALDPLASGDRVWIAFDRPEGGRAEYFLSATGTGNLRGRHIERGDYGQSRLIDEPRIAGAWSRTAAGWRVELRVPYAMVAGKFGVVIDDRDQRGTAAVSYGSLNVRNLAGGTQLVAASPQLREYLENFRQPGVRIAVGTPQGATLSQVDALPVPGALSPLQSLLSRVYRRFLERSALAERVLDIKPFQLDAALAAKAASGRVGTALLATADERRLVVAVAAPIKSRGSNQVLGVLQVAQTSDRWLSLRDRALTRLLNLTLLVTLVAFLACLGFATWLARRLIGLRDAAGNALSREGTIRGNFPGVDAPDELGDVARSFSELLGRLGSYTHYLRTLAGKLSHEIRTPLTIVRSSLDNLDREQLPSSARDYVARARAGSERLGNIVVAMGAATRVEEAISQAERSRFDLRALLSGACQAYSHAFPQRRFVLRAPQDAVDIHGAPDLIMQMMDKLIDNAVDFSPADSLIAISLESNGEIAIIDVDNTGPALPDGAEQLIFESLWQARQDRDGKPHFGLGLYVARLIAEFHGGQVLAQNLADASGVRFRITLELNKN